MDGLRGHRNNDLGRELHLVPVHNDRQRASVVDLITSHEYRTRTSLPASYPSVASVSLPRARCSGQDMRFGLVSPSPSSSAPPVQSETARIRVIVCERALNQVFTFTFTFICHPGKTHNHRSRGDTRCSARSCEHFFLRTTRSTQILRRRLWERLARAKIDTE